MGSQQAQRQDRRDVLFGGSAIYAIDAEGLRLQANAIIDAQLFREGDTLDVGISPSDGVLLGENDRRCCELVRSLPVARAHPLAFLLVNR